MVVKDSSLLLPFWSCNTSVHLPGCPKVFVATNDLELQMTSRTNRAYVVSGRRLLNEMKQAAREVVPARMMARLHGPQIVPCASLHRSERGACLQKLQEDLDSIQERGRGKQVLSKTLSSDTKASLEVLRRGCGLSFSPILYKHLPSIPRCHIVTVLLISFLF